jgi:DNA-binding transcriptional LysR family regulator
MDMHGIDLNLLVAFDALIAERSVTRAAARIGRTQPAMSAALSRLRALFRDDLFVRSPSGLQPTPRAVELATPLSESLAQIQRTLEYTQEFVPAAALSTFTLALSDHPAFALLPDLVGRVTAEAPGVVLHVRGFSDREQARELLERGDAHAAVGVPASWGSNVVSQPLFQEHFVSVVRRGHPLAKGKLTLKRFLSYPHLLVSPEGDRRSLVDAELAKLGAARHVALSLSQMYAAPGVIASSDLVATLMAGVARQFTRTFALHHLEPPVRLPSPRFVLAWHRRNDAHPAQRWLRRLLTEVAGAIKA